MEPRQSTINDRSFFYPPGGILIWIIILVEVLTFSAGIVAFVWQKTLFPDIFAGSQKALNVSIGFTNTLILLTSGFLIAESVRFIKSGDNQKSQNRMWAAMAFGLFFLVLKAIEYIDKIGHGYDLSYDTFFTFYWLLTGFHFVHVLVGLVILLILNLHIRKGFYNKNNFSDVETGAAFWHLCDIIWLMLFPVLYLLK